MSEKRALVDEASMFDFTMLRSKEANALFPDTSSA
jgi:hypothetical protein